MEKIINKIWEETRRVEREGEEKRNKKKQNKQEKEIYVYQ